MTTPNEQPWYRQLWPWLLIIPPAAAVVGGMLTLYLAITRPDALVLQSCVQDGVTMKCSDTAESKAP